MRRRIANARLGKTNTVIATMRLIDKADFADIGAAIGYSRYTASRRYNDVVEQLKNG
jgi:hypothetical protein